MHVVHVGVCSDADALSIGSKGLVCEECRRLQWKAHLGWLPGVLPRVPDRVVLLLSTMALHSLMADGLQVMADVLELCFFCFPCCACPWFVVGSALQSAQQEDVQ